MPVVHIDQDILVLDKPSGLLSVPGKTDDMADCLEARAKRHHYTARIIHRLDMDTSGLIVLGLSAKTHAHISMQFEKRQIQKSYIALVQGHLEETSGRIDQPLITDWPNRPKQMIDHQNGKQAITDWQVLETGPDFTRVKLTPITGRSHQLRVHMMHLGHPILGDNLYADKAALKARDRLCLHAETLGFTHPVSGASLHFECPTPF